MADHLLTCLHLARQPASDLVVDLRSREDQSPDVPEQHPVEFFTIGYEGRSLDEFVDILLEAGVERVVDVRELPLSRKRGFSKTVLSEALASHGIDYVHVRTAGNPHRSLRHDIKRCLAAYRSYLRENPRAVEDVMDALRGTRAALLCVEHEANACHRSVLASRLARRRNVEVAAHL